MKIIAFINIIRCLTILKFVQLYKDSAYLIDYNFYSLLHRLVITVRPVVNNPGLEVNNLSFRISGLRKDLDLFLL